MTDQPGAIPMWVNSSIVFPSTDATWIVLHKTAGFSTAQQCAAYFQNLSQNTGHVSAHYIVGLDGTIVQCVPEAQGAGANCCCTAGYASYLPTDINLNVKTISIEHIDPATDNGTPVPAAQYAASKQLVHDVCVRHNIPMRAGDASGGIIRHADIDPVNRARCPGNYPLDQLLADLQGGNNVNNTTYGPGQGSDFDSWYTVGSDGNWMCKQTKNVIIGGNLGFYEQLSIDGNTLPTPGLPRTNELYQKDADGYQWSVQFFERGLIVYDPEHHHDSQPGAGSSYLGKYEQFKTFDPTYQPGQTVTVTIEKTPASAVSDFQQIATTAQNAGNLILTMAQIADKYK